MKYTKDVMTFSNGPIISAKGDTSSHLRDIQVETTCVDFECAKCGYKSTSQPCKHDEEKEIYYFDCPECDLRYGGVFEGVTMKLYTRWMEYNPPIEE